MVSVSGQVIDNLVYENKLDRQGYKRIAGIDEAGRGPLAGPVVAAAVILPAYQMIPEVTDSKLLDDKKRRELFKLIKQAAFSIGVGIVPHAEIDRINILQATFKAMSLAVDVLPCKADYALVDGNQQPDLQIPMSTIVGGDLKSYSIAAASIIAKVTRDNLMIQYDEKYPLYSFAQNKGYSTQVHRKAIERYGPCPIHRRSFNWISG